MVHSVYRKKIEYFGHRFQSFSVSMKQLMDTLLWS